MAEHRGAATAATARHPDQKAGDGRHEHEDPQAAEELQGDEAIAGPAQRLSQCCRGSPHVRAVAPHQTKGAPAERDESAQHRPNC